MKALKRKRNQGTIGRPRLSVFRGLKNIAAQVIDDDSGRTLAAASTQEKGLVKDGGNIAAAKLVGKLVAERSLAKGITQVVFDRGKNIYHGRIKALAEAAREGGLRF